MDGIRFHSDSGQIVADAAANSTHFNILRRSNCDRPPLLGHLCSLTYRSNPPRLVFKFPQFYFVFTQRIKQHALVLFRAERVPELAILERVQGGKSLALLVANQFVVAVEI